MAQSEKKERPRGLEGALARLISAYVGGLALVATYLAALVSGAPPLTALGRGALAALLGAAVGRAAGWIVAAPLSRVLVPERPLEPEVEA